VRAEGEGEREGAEVGQGEGEESLARGGKRKGRGGVMGLGQNADGRKFSLFFCFYLFQKLFKTHLKLILNLLDFFDKATHLNKINEPS